MKKPDEVTIETRRMKKIRLIVEDLSEKMQGDQTEFLTAVFDGIKKLKELKPLEGND